MIAVVVVGALLGAVLFALLLRLAPPTAAPLVQLAREAEAVRRFEDLVFNTIETFRAGRNG